jgi:hypothetical protein
MGIVIACKRGYWWLGIYGRHPHNILKIGLEKKKNILLQSAKI